MSGMEKTYELQGRPIFLGRKIFVKQCRNKSCETLQCFRKIRLSKNCMHNRVVARFPTKNVWSHSAPKIRG